MDHGILIRFRFVRGGSTLPRLLISINSTFAWGRVRVGDPGLVCPSGRSLNDMCGEAKGEVLFPWRAAFLHKSSVPARFQLGQERGRGFTGGASVKCSFPSSVWMNFQSNLQPRPPIQSSTKRKEKNGSANQERGHTNELYFVPGGVGLGGLNVEIDASRFNATGVRNRL